MGGQVAGLFENITNSAQIELGLGLSLAKMTGKMMKKTKLEKSLKRMMAQVYQSGMKMTLSISLKK